MGSSYNKILNVNKLLVDEKNKKIFLGEYSGFQRYDNPKYSFFVKQEEKQRNAFWNPNEISMVNDSIKFFDLPEGIQTVEKKILGFQTIMDSGQNQGIESVLAEVLTNEEAEAMAKTHGYFELIHSLSYSHIVRGIFSDSKAIFDDIENDEYIKNRINDEIELYSKLKKLTNIEELVSLKNKINKNIEKYIEKNKIKDTSILKTVYDVQSVVEETFNFEFKGIQTEEEKKKLILELLISVLALEGVKFYVSFLVTYIINNSYNGAISGTTRIIKLINFDEDIHTVMIAGLINILKKNKEEGFSELIKSEWFSKKVVEIFTKVYEDEMGWGKYLLSIADIPSLTEEVTSQFIKYWIDERVSSIGQPKIYNQKKTDVINFFIEYKNMDLDNVAQQESDLAIYAIGILKNDLPEGKIEIKRGFDKIKHWENLNNKENNNV